MSSKRMSLLPRATLHSDSEQLAQIARMLLLVNYWHSLDTATVLVSHEVVQECQLTAHNGIMESNAFLKIRHCS